MCNTKGTLDFETTTPLVCVVCLLENPWADVTLMDEKPSHRYTAKLRALLPHTSRSWILTALVLMTAAAAINAWDYAFVGVWFIAAAIAAIAKAIRVRDHELDYQEQARTFFAEGYDLEAWYRADLKDRRPNQDNQ